MTDLRMNPIELRNARPEDAATLRDLAMSAAIDAWSEADYTAEISNPNSIVLCALREQTIVGFVVSRVVPGSAELPEAEIYNIAVNMGSRRSGVGARLIAELIRRLTLRNVVDLWLEVRESNRSAVEFYENNGFAAEVTRRNFYSNPPENAIVMRRRLEPTINVTGL